jgi:hypothetical protein
MSIDFATRPSDVKVFRVVVFFVVAVAVVAAFFF